MLAQTQSARVSCRAAVFCSAVTDAGPPIERQSGSAEPEALVEGEVQAGPLKMNVKVEIKIQSGEGTADGTEVGRDWR